jgi:hypothetical protein
VQVTDHETVARYLPSNYAIVAQGNGWLYIEGEDDHGWTLDEYVIPRLASGLIFAEEISQGQADYMTLGTEEERA